MKKRKRIVELEIMRVIAAIVIVLFHMNVLPGGLLAVEFFAILSGLLMAHSMKKISHGSQNGILMSTGVFLYKKLKFFIRSY